MKKSPLPLQNICGSDKQISEKEALTKLLRWHFGHAEFRGKQLEAIQAVLSGPRRNQILSFAHLSVCVRVFSVHASIFHD